MGYSNESKAYRVWIPSLKKIRISRDVKFFDEHFSDHDKTRCSGTTPDATHPATTEIATNSGTGEDIEYVAIDEPDASVHDQPIGQDDDAGIDQTTHEKRGPGSPRLIRTGGRGRPSKQYNIVRTDANQGSSCGDVHQNEDPTSSVASESDEDGWYDSFSGMCMAEIPFSQAIAGDDAEQWKDAIYEEMKYLVDNDTWDIVEIPQTQKSSGRGSFSATSSTQKDS